MSLEAAFYTYLSAELDPLIDGRLFPKRAPEGTLYPYATYERVSAQRSYTHDPFPEERAWVRARFSVACSADSMLRAIEVGNVVVAALSGFSGDMAGVAIGLCDIANELDLYDPQTKAYRRIVDVFVEHQELEPAS